MRGKREKKIALKSCSFTYILGKVVKLASAAEPECGKIIFGNSPSKIFHFSDNSFSRSLKGTSEATLLSTLNTLL